MVNDDWLLLQVWNKPARVGASMCKVCTIQQSHAWWLHDDDHLL